MPSDAGRGRRAALTSNVAPRGDPRRPDLLHRQHGPELHPALAQGTRRGNDFDVVRLADDVEDMQIAYGVDTDGNNGINRLTGGGGDPTIRPERLVRQAGGDEWVPTSRATAVDDASSSRRRPRPTRSPRDPAPRTARGSTP